MRERCQWLLIAGTDEPLAEVRRHLPKALREHVAREIIASVNGSTDAILARVPGLEQAMERRVEAERVPALMARCPLCDTGLDPQLDIVERAIE